MNRKRWFVASSLVLALATGVASAAVRDNPKFQPNATDQKIARAVVLRQDDLADLAVAWKGGFEKSSPTGMTWPGYTMSDLVVTGAATTRFTSDAGYISSVVWVLKTREMVQLDQRRLAAVPVLDQVRRSYDDAPASVKLVSVSRLAGFPRLAPYMQAVRAVYDYTANGTTTRGIRDSIDLFTDRTEILLSVTAAYAFRKDVTAVEVDFAKLLVDRATPPKVAGYMLPLDISIKAGSSYTFGKGLTLRLDKLLAPGDRWLDNTGPISIGTSPDSLTCTATLGGKPIVGTGKGGCRWQIPTTAVGKRLVVTATARLMGAEKTITLPLMVE